MLPLLCSLLSVLPANEQYAEKSLPAGIARKLEPALEPKGGICRSEVPRPGAFAVGGDPAVCPADLSSVTAFRCALLSSPLPRRCPWVSRGRPGERRPGRRRPRDRDSGRAVVPCARASKAKPSCAGPRPPRGDRRVPRWFRDPLTRERIDAGELRGRRGMADLQNGNFTVAAGRFHPPVPDPCAVLDVETLATALLEAHLFHRGKPRRRCGRPSMPGHRTQDLTSLASLLHAEGREDATLVEAKIEAENPRRGPLMLAVWRSSVAVIPSGYDRIGSDVAELRTCGADRRQCVALDIRHWRRYRLICRTAAALLSHAYVKVSQMEAQCTRWRLMSQIDVTLSRLTSICDRRPRSGHADLPRLRFGKLRPPPPASGRLGSPRHTPRWSSHATALHRWPR